MYIKRLEIYGFKSFPYKVSLNFSKGITAIVGPNGAGKSNLLDAIKWVLGEQSPKRLRVRDLSELIYSGNTDKKIDFAEVKLILTHDPPIFEKYKNFEEITIIRRYYRDGESEFYINNKPCRLKDIHFLFLDLGINPQSYGIIDQGEIYKFLEISPKERRKFLEDLAGISKLKLVQEETERNIEQTQNNLFRLNDIIKEIENQYFHLKEQSEKAKEYIKLKEELKKLSLQKNWYLFTHSIKRKEEFLLALNEIKREKSEITNNLEELEKKENKLYQELIKKEKELKEIKKEYLSYKEELKNLDGELNNLYKIESDLVNKKEKEEIKEQLNKQRKEELLKELTSIEGVLDTINKKERKLQEDLQQLKEKKSEKEVILEEKTKRLCELNKQFQESNNEYLKAKETINTLSNSIGRNKKELEEMDKILQQNKDILKELKEKESLLKNKEKNIEVSLNSLHKELTEINETFLKIEKHLTSIREEKEKKLRDLSAIEANLKLIQELIKEDHDLKSYSNKTLGEILDLPPEELSLLESYYGDLLKALLVNDWDEIETILGKYPGENLIFLLKEALEKIPLKITIVEHLDKKVSYEKKDFFIYYKDKNLLLSPAGFALYLVKQKRGLFSLKKEKELLENKKKEILEGINQMTNKEKDLLKEKKNLEDKRNYLSTEIKKLDKNLNSIQKEMRELELEKIKLLEKENFLNSRKEELNKSIKESLKALENYNHQIRHLEEVINSLKKHKSHLEEDFNKISKEIKVLQDEIISQEKELIKLNSEKNNLLIRKNNLQKEVEKIEKSIKNFYMQREVLKKEIEEIKDKILNLKEKKREIISNIQTLEPLIINLEEEISHFNSELREISKIKKSLENKKNHLDIEIHNLDIKIAEINLIIEKLKEERKEWEENEEIYFNNKAEEIDLEKINFKIENIKKELKNFEDVNLASIKEFELISERYHNLLNQKKDLERALHDLKELLQELKEKAKKQLKDTLNKVNQKLKEIFPLIMEKGSAELFFTENDPLTSGLDLKITLPHKKIQHLHILSGGEKALCVIALLIAFYLTKPGPFCILDEVDAPLDEKNSIKFINLLKKIKENSQIILITHNPNIMKEVDSIFGVTMEEKGVSKIVKLELNNYLK